MTPPRRRRRWPWIVVVLLVAGGGFLLMRRGGAAKKDVDQSLVVAVKRADLEIAVIETGKVQPREKVEIKSKVAGQVERVLVREGERVRKGQLLLRLDATDFKREVARTEGEVAQARNSLDYARLVLGRKQKALEVRAVTQADVDLAQNDVRARTVALQLAEVALGAAEDRLRYTQIVAPMDGTVIQRGIEAGEVVTPGVQATFEGKALLTIADLGTLMVRVELNQIDVAKVRVGQRVTLTLDALPGRKYQATISKIAPAATSVKGKDVEVFPVEATIEGSDGEIRPGMTADARIQIETRRQVLVVPIEAILRESGKMFVTRVDRPAGAAKPATAKVEVKVGARNDREMEILSGAAEGDSILIKPASAAENEYKM